MTTPPVNTERDYEAMEARSAQLRAQVLETAHRIIEVVKRDIEKFAERESRWRFLRHLDFAEGLSDAQIATLKRALKAYAVEAGEEVSRRLGEESAWIKAELPRGGNAKTLEHNEAVWDGLQSIASGFAAVLERFGFPADPPPEGGEGAGDERRYRLVYRTPVYFLDGVYCPSLIESYWSQLGEMNKLNDAIESASSETRRKSLEERWNRS